MHLNPESMAALVNRALCALFPRWGNGGRLPAIRNVIRERRAANAFPDDTEYRQAFRGILKHDRLFARTAR